MKRYLIIILLGFTACSSLKNNKQLVNGSIAKYQPLKKFNGDTLLFVKNSILARKEYYVGKELNVLLKDLRIPVKKYLTGISSKVSVDPGLYLNIYSNTEQENKVANGIDPIQITILWKTPLSSEETDSLLRRSHLNWTPEVAAYYGNQIVGDVGIVQYNFK
ncbi:hypothetical protein N9R54_04400 [Pelobium sp.]|nr:hypothetical protein [Pelobium sp.]MDA9555455.1 hypothetical protein [Pelobium sp.]